MSPVHLDDERAISLLEGLLPARERALAEDHVKSCAGCRTLVDEHRALAAALSDLPAPVVPADFTEVVLARVEERARLASRERRTAALVLGGAAVALAALAALAGPAALAPALSRVGDAAGAAATWLRIGSDVAEPLLRALRLEIAAATAGAAIPLLYALRRLAHRGAEATT